jgi:hypothetical protein
VAENRPNTPLTKSLEPLEQRLVYAAGLYTAVATVIVTGPYLSGHHPKVKGSPVVALAIGLGAAALVLVAGRLRNRMGAAVAAGVAGVAPWGGILSFPVLALSAWLLMRNNRRLRAERGDRPAPVRGQRPARRRKDEADEADSRRRPPASKRYTPPKPPPTKPGRRGRG